MWANAALVLLFVLVGGVFSATEMALVSLRASQLRGMADKGRRGARVAAVAGNPNRFLGAVQIGVTLAGFLSAAFGAATLAGELSPVLRGWGLSSGVADAVALVAITLVISYLSLVLGELAPKRIALQRAESLAMLVAPTLDRFATAMSPVIWLLSRSTDLVVRLLGGDPNAGRNEITDEELRTLVTGHHALSPEERELIEEVFEAGDRSLREVMVPRTEVDFLDASMPAVKAVKVVSELTHSRFPVVRGDPDDVVGFVHVRDLYGPRGAERGARVGDLAREVMLLPDGKAVLPALSEMRRSGHHLAIVVDEYGGTAGIVTLEDIVEELIGDIRDEYDVEEEPSRLVGGVLDVDGLLNLDDFEDAAGFALPEGPYETVAGYVLAALGHIPQLGEHVDVEGYRLSVIQTDGRRVARVRVAPVG
ncbi:MAG TPA: hemolysin family protein [Actinomycetes bacterium]